MISNYAPHERAETHEWIAAPPTFVSEAGIVGPQALPFQPIRTASDRWQRGSLRASLEAPSIEVADQVIDEYIAHHLPAIALDAPAGTLASFWLELALANGMHRQSIWTKGGTRPRRAQIEQCIVTALAHDVIFELDQWPGNDAVPSPLIYFRDHGLLRRLLDMHDEVAGGAIAKIIEEGERSRAEAKLVEKRRRRDDLSWEGFVIDALRVLTSGTAKAFVWRRDPDEIDLVLKWRSGTLWGIEVTRGEGWRKPADGFFEGCRQLGISERFVVAPAPAQRVRRGVVCLDLSEALERTREQLS